MTTEENILCNWKGKTKTYIFKIYYLTKQRNIQALQYSYIKGFQHEDIIKDMLNVSQLDNFLKWLTPVSQEYKDYKQQFKEV